MNNPNRRSFLANVTLATGVVAAAGTRGFTQSTAGEASISPEWIPQQAPSVVKEMVGVAHGSLARVRELVERQPALANATIDWGFGDWEDALGAASHMGRREIAEFLLAQGARPTLFSAAMLGQVDVVKAVVGATPGVQRTLGPHGITLLAHARAGGPGAVEVVKYLESVGDADRRPATQPLEPADRDAVVGEYHVRCHGSRPVRDRRPGRSARNRAARADAPHVVSRWQPCVLPFGCPVVPYWLRALRRTGDPAHPCQPGGVSYGQTRGLT